MKSKGEGIPDKYRRCKKAGGIINSSGKVKQQKSAITEKQKSQGISKFAAFVKQGRTEKDVVQDCRK